jgi:hypothetical protein
MITIFYSWQSDLPNSTNRGFIEACLKKAIKNLNKSQEYNIEFNLDRDTKNATGTPDIANTIFKKIEKAHIFLADISIINPTQNSRKTPNPNVLLELGYAAKTLGWERVICVINTIHGKIEELPFDLKFRRPISFTLDQNNDNKTKEFLSNKIEDSILSIQKSGLLNNDLFDYLKVQIDTEILSILNQLHKIFYNYKKRQFTYESISKFVQFNAKELIQLLNDNEIIGFKIFKKWEETENNLHAILEKPFFAKNLDDKSTSIIINLIKDVSTLDMIHRNHRNFTVTNRTDKDYKIVHGTDINIQNQRYPDRYLLLDKANQVRDFGDFRHEDIKRLFDIYIIPENYKNQYCKIVYETLHTINMWLEATGWEFIIDTKSYKRRSTNLTPKK